MSRQAYLATLCIGLSLFTLYTMIGVFTRWHIPGAEYFKIVLVAMICIGEASRANRKIGNIVFGAMVVCVVSLLFVVQHWPWGKTGFTISGMIILSGLLANTLLYARRKLASTLLLVFPVLFFIYLETTIYALPGKPTYWWLVVLSIPVSAFGAGLLLVKEKAK